MKARRARVIREAIDYDRVRSVYIKRWVTEKVPPLVMRGEYLLLAQLRQSKSRAVKRVASELARRSHVQHIRRMALMTERSAELDALRERLKHNDYPLGIEGD